MKGKAQNLKKTVALLLSGILVLATGCRSQETPASSSPSQTVSASTSDALTGSPSGTDTSTDNSASTSVQTEGTKATTTRGKTTTKPTSPQTTAGPAAVSPHVNKTLAPMTSEDAAVLLENPDRGFRWEIHMDIGLISEEANFDRMKAAARRFFKTMEQPEFPVKLVQVYIEITHWRDRDISEKGLQAVDAVLEAGAELGYKMLARISYITDWAKSMQEYAEADVMMRHIDQLAPVIHKHEDDIFALQAAFYGAWGEWHSNGKEFDDATLSALITKIGNTLLTDDMYMMARLPYWKNLLPKGSDVYKRTGIHKDNFFGKSTNRSGEVETEEKGFWDGTASWKQLTAEAAYTPQDGETFWEDDLHKAQEWADGYESILGMFEHRYSCFSGLHGNYDWGSRSDTTMGRWRRQSVTVDWLKANNVIGSPSWFLDKDGNAVERNVYEFIMYHLGYYVEAKSVQTSGGSKPGETLKVTLPLVNHGFAAAFNMRSGFAILDENNEVVVTQEAGDPETWYNRAPDQAFTTSQLTHTITASLKLPAKAGHYKLAFYLRNDRGDFARIANQVETANGYHILHEFDI